MEIQPDPPPEPEKTGVELGQTTPTAEESHALVRTAAAGEGIRPFELSDALTAIGELGVRGLAGTVLLNSHAVRLERELQQLRLERNEALRKAEEYQGLYHDERERSAVLGVRLSAAQSVGHIRQAVLSLGGIVLGAGIPGILTSPQPVWAAPAMVVGVVLLIIGWLVPLRTGQTP